MKKKAFTLIELLIVIAIIGVLATALFPTIRDAMSRSRDAAKEGDINNIVTALETYNADYGTYPQDSGCITDTTIFVEPGTTESVAKDYFKGGKPPKDPSANRSLPSTVADPGGCVLGEPSSYYYKFINGNGVEYIIGTVMETDKKNNSNINPEDFDGSGDYSTGDLLWFMRVL